MTLSPDRSSGEAVAGRAYPRTAAHSIGDAMKTVKELLQQWKNDLREISSVHFPGQASPLTVNKAVQHVLQNAANVNRLEKERDRIEKRKADFSAAACAGASDAICEYEKAAAESDAIAEAVDTLDEIWRGSFLVVIGNKDQIQNSLPPRS